MAAGQSQKNAYPETDVTTLNLGLHDYDQGDYEQAIVEFNIAIMSQPTMGEAYNDRGLTYYAMGETEKALADFNKAIELMPDPAVPYSNRGVSIFSRENTSWPWLIWIKPSNFLRAWQRLIIIGALRIWTGGTTIKPLQILTRPSN